MKTIGLIGGMSWEASARYYRLINKGVRDKLGKLHSAKIVMYSVDFYELERLQRAERWIEASYLIGAAAEKLKRAGADFFAICSVTGHEGAGIIENEVNIPLLHIADSINDKIEGIDKIGLIGTRYTMEMEYFKDKIKSEVIIPDSDDCKIIDDIIYKELCLGEVKQSSRNVFKMIIEGLVSKGVRGIILGCTEIGILIRQQDCHTPVFDSTIIHTKAIVDYACGNDNNL